MSTVEAIRTKLADPGFTAGKRDVAPLFELLAAADEDEATKVVRALAAVPRAIERALAEWDSAVAPLRHRLITIVARSRTGEAADVLLRAVTDEDPRTRKAAARGLGKLEDTQIHERVASALREQLTAEKRPEVTRAIVEALGKVGGASEASALENIGGDASTDRVKREAVRRIARAESREIASRIVAERVHETPFEVELRSREGLESITAKEVPGSKVERAGFCVVSARSLRELTVGRTWSSVALRIHRGKDVEDERLAQIIAGAAPLLQSLTDGVVRWRVDWIGAGHKRAATRELAERVEALAPGLVNDPIASDWEIEIARERGELAICALPKSWDDVRFAYRVADVPAASHPAIAAALAHVAGARNDDVVWDPFVGSGLELVERARLGPYRTLLGSDIDTRALAAAKKNFDAARVSQASLERADARTFKPRNITLAITNPPMGRRIQSGKLDDLLITALENIATSIVRGGRLVWITPHSRTTNQILERAGMKRTEDLVIDMRGFAANLQRWSR